MWRSRSALAFLAAALFLAPLPVAVAGDPPCAPGLGVGLVEFPAGSRDPRAHLYIVDHVQPGARFSRRFQICNGTGKPVTVSLYAAAADVSGGDFNLADGHTQNELSGWISITPAHQTLAVGQRAIARASFSVPAQAESGERYAVLLAEVVPDNPGGGVTVARRVGIRIYLDVGPGGAPKSDFVIDTLQASRTQDGKGQVTAQVHNTGARALDITGSLSLSNGPNGLKGGPYPARLGSTLAPGDTEPVAVPIDTAVAAGPWNAQLVLRSGLIERRVEAPLTFPDQAGAEGPAVDVERITPSTDQEIKPARVLGLVALILLVVAGFAFARRRRTSS